MVYYFRNTYPKVLITPSLGDNQITLCSRIESKAKEYLEGQPDLELKCEDGERIDIIAIENTNPNKSHNLSIHHKRYTELANGMKVQTVTSKQIQK